MTRGIPKQTEVDPVASGEELYETAAAIVEEAKANEANEAGKTQSKSAGKSAGKSPKAKPAAEVKPATYAPSPTEKAPSMGPDPFDPQNFRYDPQNMEGLTQRVWTEGQIQVRKPDDQEWFRVRPGPEWQLQAALLLLKRDKKYRLIAPAIAPAVRAAKSMTLRLCVTVGGTPILWPVPMPAADGRDYPYWESARGIAAEAEVDWIHMYSDQEAGCYRSERAGADYGPPKWPNLTFRDLLRLAFGKTGVITSLDHPDLMRLAGKM